MPGLRHSDDPPAAPSSLQDPESPSGAAHRQRGRRNAAQGPGSAGIHAFLGASFLTAALLLPHARALSVGGGIVLAGLLLWSWSRFVP